MSILKKKFNSVIALLLALIFLLSASVEISYAMDVDKKSLLNMKRFVM